MISIECCYKIVDIQTSFVLCWGVGVGKCGKVGHFTSDPATVVSTVAHPGYGRHGSCHGRDFDGCEKIACKKL